MTTTVVTGLDASVGKQWISEAWDIFKKAPLFIWGVVILWLVLMSILGMIPLLGQIISLALTPIFGIGLATIYNTIEEGNEPEVSDLFIVTQNPTLWVKLVIGYIVGLLLIGVAIVIAAGIVMMMVGSHPTGSGILIGALLFLPLALLFVFPVCMTMYFSPLLIAFNDTGILESFNLSFKACISNIVPWLVYGLLMFGLVIVSIITLGFGFLVTIPIMMISSYVAYKYLFTQEA